MRKRIISLLLVVCMVMTFLPADIMAAKVKRLASSKAAPAAASAAGDNPFTDVLAGSWYASAVDYVRANGFFNGTSATTFEPNGTMTRGMFVTVLGRMARVDTAGYTGSSGFSDVKATAMVRALCQMGGTARHNLWHEC